MPSRFSALALAAALTLAPLPAGAQMAPPVSIEEAREIAAEHGLRTIDSMWLNSSAARGRSTAATARAATSSWTSTPTPALWSMWTANRAAG